MPFEKIEDEKDAWVAKPCSHREHDPPGHIVLKPGTYRYTCPGCKRSVTIRVPLIRW